jgi:hypothetical protein
MTSNPTTAIRRGTLRVAVPKGEVKEALSRTTKAPPSARIVPTRSTNIAERP